ncbi:MAG TPA: hypothetical protein VGM49_02280 [Candidatus Limnocylindrales bacterium]
MTDQPAPEGTGMPSPEMPSAEPPPLAPLVAAAATPPPMPPPAAMAAPAAPPPPAVAWQAPPPVAVKGGRTGLAAAAGVIMLILGILGMVLGVLFFAGTALIGSLGDFQNIPGLPEGTNGANVVTGVLVFFGVIIVAYSLVYIIGSIGVLRSKGWGRVMGIVVGVLSGLFWLAGLSGSGSSSSGGGGSLIFVIVLLALHVYVFVTLAFFWRSKATA